MPIDQTIRQSRLETELFEKGYTYFDIYGKPNRFASVYKHVRKIMSTIFTILFFVLLLYEILLFLIKLNEIVEAEQLNDCVVSCVLFMKRFLFVVLEIIDKFYTNVKFFITQFPSSIIFPFW